MKHWPFEHILPRSVYEEVFHKDAGLVSKYVRQASAIKVFGKDLVKHIKLYQNRHESLGFKVQHCLYPKDYVNLILKGCHYCGKNLLQDNGIGLLTFISNTITKNADGITRQVVTARVLGWSEYVEIDV
jgi:hypothetical protein